MGQIASSGFIRSSHMDASPCLPPQVRDIIRTNLGSVMLAILQPVHRFKLWILRWAAAHAAPTIVTEPALLLKPVHVKWLICKRLLAAKHVDTPVNTEAHVCAPAHPLQAPPA
jgi:hypothetical protein